MTIVLVAVVAGFVGGWLSKRYHIIRVERRFKGSMVSKLIER